MFVRSFLSGRIQFLMLAIFLLLSHSQSCALGESVSRFQVMEDMECDDQMPWVFKFFLGLM